jgi:putative transposase
MRSRKTLPHEVPVWIDPARETYFITVCCKERGRNQLAVPAAASPLIETIEHRNTNAIWYAHIALIMPDHVHLLLSFPACSNKLQRVVTSWKDWTAKRCGVVWQRDFFEHRLRKEESYREKADYILANPVRAGLVADADNWPYVLIAP